MTSRRRLPEWGDRGSLIMLGFLGLPPRPTHTTRRLQTGLKMKNIRVATLLLWLPLFSLADVKDADLGLIFNESKLTFGAPLDSENYHGVKSALLVHPEDLPELKHYSNSNMARGALHMFSPGGGAQAHVIEEFREQAFIVLEGAMDFTVDGKVLKARLQDVVFIPPGVSRSFAVAGDEPAKVLQVEWYQKGPRPEAAGKAVIVSERLRPAESTGGEGYVGVTPNARQQGIPLSITSYGAGHIRSKNTLLLYHMDLEGARPFTANTRLARMGLSAYSPEGGTRWHSHAKWEQCLVILSGKGLVEIGANTFEAKPGDIIFAPRHVGHGYRTTGDEPFKFFEVEWGRD